VNYRIVVEIAGEGYSAYSPDVPGVGVAGESRDEVERLLQEAIAFHLSPPLDVLGGAELLQPPGTSGFEYRTFAKHVPAHVMTIRSSAAP
jgi:hypothetical protein